MQNHQASEIGPRCVVYCFHDRLLFWNGLLFRSQEECTVFSFERLRCWEASPLTRWVTHTRIPWEEGGSPPVCRAPGALSHAWRPAYLHYQCARSPRAQHARHCPPLCPTL